MRLDRKGFTLLEVIIAAGSIALIAYSFSSVMDIRSQQLLKVHFSYILSDVVVANVNEVKSKNFDLLPKTDKCLVRKYKLDQNEDAVFDSDTEVDSSSSLCGGNPLSQRVIEIYWKVRGSAEIKDNFDFTPSEFLKLPTHKNSIIEVEIKGRMLSTGASPTEQVFGTIIYRK